MIITFLLHFKEIVAGAMRIAYGAHVDAEIGFSGRFDVHAEFGRHLLAVLIEHFVESVFG